MGFPDILPKNENERLPRLHRGGQGVREKKQPVAGLPDAVGHDDHGTKLPESATSRDDAGPNFHEAGSHRSCFGFLFSGGGNFM